MSPFPVRVEMKASRVPSGDQSGRLSVAGCETSSRASPPANGTVQMSPPETKAISLWSGERLGSAIEGVAVTAEARALRFVAVMTIAARASTMARGDVVGMDWRVGLFGAREDATPNGQVPSRRRVGEGQGSVSRRLMDMPPEI